MMNTINLLHVTWSLHLPAPDLGGAQGALAQGPHHVHVRAS